MTSINEFINNINSNKNNGNSASLNLETKTNVVPKNEQTSEQKTEQQDSFEKEDKKINQKAVKIGAFLTVSLAALIAFFKRKNISNFFSDLFNNKQQQKMTEKVSSDIIQEAQETIPIKHTDDISKTAQTAIKSAFEALDINEQAKKTMQTALDDLTIRADDKALNSGIGFIGENIEKREKALQAFLDKVQEKGYEIVKIPTKDEATPDEITLAINKAMETAKDNFQQTGKRSILVIRDLDVLGADRSTEGEYVKVARNLLRVEHCKDEGYAWIWDAKTGKSIDKSLLKRSPQKIVIDK